MNNPIANEGFMSKIKNKLNKKKENSNTMKSNGGIYIETVAMNNYIDICAAACACCWDRPIPETFEDRANYIGKRVRMGHSSVIEHSNYVIYIEVPKNYCMELMNIMSKCRYLETWTASHNDNCMAIIGGSLRGYSELLKSISDFNDPIIKGIIGNLYEHIHSAMFEDLIDIGILERDKFLNYTPDTEDFENYNKIIDNVGIIEVDTDAASISTIFNTKNISSHCIEEKFYKYLKDVSLYAYVTLSPKDASRFITLTVLFKDMSRTCTHQLVRHRNAITQESQRYVNASNAKFSSPAKFKPDKYDEEHKYSVRFPNCGITKLTLQEIGDAECDLYRQLSDKAITGANNALIKEDARAFLPGNVQCGKIFMTFTYKNLYKFLKLRTDKAAQDEIREFATSLEGFLLANELIFKPYDYFIKSEYEYINMEDSEKEKYSDITGLKFGGIENLANFEFDKEYEMMFDDATEVVDITEEDYIRAAGLDKEGNEERNEK